MLSSVETKSLFANRMGHLPIVQGPKGRPERELFFRQGLITVQSPQGIPSYLEWRYHIEAHAHGEHGSEWDVAHRPYDMVTVRAVWTEGATMVGLSRISDRFPIPRGSGR
jgi:hypothetical protein